MKDMQRFFLSTIGIMVTTVLHHFYGAAIYPQIFRAYIGLVGIPIVVVEYLLYRQYLKKGGKIVSILLQFIAIVIAMLMIGFYEGGYNHLLKNILFFSGTKTSVLTRLFPPPEYEMPDNFFFEFTGILQFVLAVAALVFFIRYKRTAKTIY